MRIVSLTSENVKRLKAVHIQPDGVPVVVVGGRNEQGKTSVLDSIEYALGGKPKDPKPIHEGEKRARVIIDTNEYKVTRTFSESGSKLQVETKGGAVMKSPQQVLDKIVGGLSFDPLSFASKPEKEQAAMLQEMIGLDFDALHRERQEHYDNRTEINRDLKKVQAQLSECPRVKVDPVSVEKLMEELEAADEYNKKGDEIDSAIERKQLNLGSKKQDIQKMESEIEKLQEKILEIQATIKSTQSYCDMINKELSELTSDKEKFFAKPTDEIRAKIKGAQEVNSQAAAYQRGIALLKEEESLTQQANELTKKIEEIDERKKNAIASAKLPVNGLGFGEDGVTYKGIPFKQCSSAERLRVSMAMGIALNPELRIMLIRDGSLLDKDSMKMISEMAEASDTQVWMERVSDDGEGCTVVIEDGSIKERN